MKKPITLKFKVTENVLLGDCTQIHAISLPTEESKKFFKHEMPVNITLGGVDPKAGELLPKDAEFSIEIKA